MVDNISMLIIEIHVSNVIVFGRLLQKASEGYFLPHHRFHARAGTGFNRVKQRDTLAIDKMQCHGFLAIQIAVRRNTN